MGKSKREMSLQRALATCPPAFNYVTFYTHDEHHRSPSVCHRSSRSPGRVKGDEGGGSVLRTGKCLYKINFIFFAKILDDLFHILDQMSKAGIRPKFDPFIFHKTPQYPFHSPY